MQPISRAAVLVEHFHDVFDAPIRHEPNVPDADERHLREVLLQEEFSEYLRASGRGDIVEVADGLADMVYVIYGTALVWGIDLDAVLEEVHRSNMSKLSLCNDCGGDATKWDDDGSLLQCGTCLGRGLRVLRRPDGKILKGEGFQPPNIAAVLGVTVDASSTADQ